MPYKPRTLFDSIEDVSLIENGIHFKSNIKHYIKRGSVGIQIYRPDKKDLDFHLLTQNTHGCITTQLLSQKKIENYFNERNIETMKNWHSIAKSEFYVTNATNFRSLVDVLKFDMHTGNESEEFEMPSRDRPHWKRTIEELATFKDILASNLLQTWEFDTDLSTFKNMSRPPVEETVSNWLQNTQIADGNGSFFPYSILTI